VTDTEVVIVEPNPIYGQPGITVRIPTINIDYVRIKQS
jgi:hypothetical protein